MIITITTLYDQKFLLSFNGVITIQMIKQKLLEEYNFNSSNYIFCQCGKVLEDNLETLVRYDNPIVIFNNQTFPEKSFPKGNNAFKINFSRYSNMFINYETNNSSHYTTDLSDEYDIFLDENQMNNSNINSLQMQINQDDNQLENMNNNNSELEETTSEFSGFYRYLNSFTTQNNYELLINHEQGGRIVFGLDELGQISERTNQIDYIIQPNNREHNFQNRPFSVRIMCTFNIIL